VAQVTTVVDRKSFELRANPTHTNQLCNAPFYKRKLM